MNNNHYKNASFDFSSEQENSIDLIDDGQHIAFPFAEEVGVGNGIMLNLTDDISVFSAKHAYNAPNIGNWYDFGKAEGHFYDDALMISTSWGGSNNFIDHDLDVEFSFDATNTMFKHANRFSFDMQHQAVTNLKVTTISIPLASVIKLIGESNTQFLLDNLNINRSPSVAVVAIPNHINNILNMAVASHVTGAMKRLFAQAKVFEYFSELVNYFEHCHITNTQTKFNDKQNQSLVQEAYQLIVTKANSIQSLTELAQLLGVSTRKLNQSFKAEFDMTPHQFMINQRLQYAHNMLLESRITQKQLAYDLGYSHVNHFITAFKRHFGYPPGYLQKQK